MLVVDASAVVELLLGRPAGDEVAAHLVAHDHDLHAPHLLDVEVLNALRRVVTRGDASHDRATEAVEDLLDLTIERYPHHILAPRIWELGTNFSAYDATYLALTEALQPEEASLLTADARLARAARVHSNAPTLLAAR